MRPRPASSSGGLGLLPLACCFLLWPDYPITSASTAAAADWSVYFGGFLSPHEMDELDYQVVIEAKPVVIGGAKDDDDKDDDAGQEQPRQQTMTMVNKFGQRYQCVLPSEESPPAPAEASSASTSTSDSSSDPPPPPKSTQQQILEALSPMQEGPCLMHHAGWWTYEFCYRQHVRQFHIKDHVVDGEITSLGDFSHDYEWPLNKAGADSTSWNRLGGGGGILGGGGGIFGGGGGRNSNNVAKHHSQYYDNGTFCEITSKPRKVEVKFVCDPKLPTDLILEVHEPLSCEYTLTVATAKLCSVESLKVPPPSEPKKIVCSPALTPEQMEKYKLYRQAKEELRRIEEREMRKKQKEYLAKLVGSDQLNGMNVNSEEGIEQLENLMENQLADKLVGELATLLSPSAKGSLPATGQTNAPAQSSRKTYRLDYDDDEDYDDFDDEEEDEEDEAGPPPTTPNPPALFRFMYMIFDVVVPIRNGGPLLQKLTRRQEPLRRSLEEAREGASSQGAQKEAGSTSQGAQEAGATSDGAQEAGATSQGVQKEAGATSKTKLSEEDRKFFKRLDDQMAARAYARLLASEMREYRRLTAELVRSRREIEEKERELAELRAALGDADADEGWGLSPATRRKHMKHDNKRSVKKELREEEDDVEDEEESTERTHMKHDNKRSVKKELREEEDDVEDEEDLEDARHGDKRSSGKKELGESERLVSKSEEAVPSLLTPSSQNSGNVQVVKVEVRDLNRNNAGGEAGTDVATTKVASSQDEVASRFESMLNKKLSQAGLDTDGREVEVKVVRLGGGGGADAGALSDLLPAGKEKDKNKNKVDDKDTELFGVDEDEDEKKRQEDENLRFKAMVHNIMVQNMDGYADIESMRLDQRNYKFDWQDRVLDKTQKDLEEKVKKDELEKQDSAANPADSEAESLGSDSEAESLGSDSAKESASSLGDSGNSSSSKNSPEDSKDSPLNSMDSLTDSADSFKNLKAPSGDLKDSSVGSSDSPAESKDNSNTSDYKDSVDSEDSSKDSANN